MPSGDVGLIPACAGKTGSTPTPSPTAAHPRVCRESLADELTELKPGGSSPRVRGKLKRARGFARCVWLIPACAGKTSSASPRPGVPAAHPRVCGENVGSLHGPLIRRGSSPRVRGKRVVSVFAVGDARLIPACAGKTPHPPIGARARRAHPRVCGENGARGGVVVLVAGSSPRVRGKPQVRQDRVRTRGLIPACAGKTPTRAAPTLRSPAHPRVCGENTVDVHAEASVRGSSPRVRGKPGGRRAHRPRGRLIPACAGKTCPRRSPAHGDPAHPRVCGENLPRPGQDQHPRGSSPRVRGKPLPVAQGPPRGGLIPACAGKTRGAGLQVQDGPAHPRVCGENAGGDHVEALPAGSSPRVRGKPSQRPRASAPGRLIPACAGKTRRRCMARRPLAAHPRVCGENPRRGPAAPTTPGSSPRVRGKLGAEWPGFAISRLIPACAGKTRTAPSGRASPTAHPRVCGENEAMGRPSLSRPGSSPRVRGKLGAEWPGFAISRLIPACAGKTSGHVAERAVEVGSSPRVRGKRPLGLLGLRDRGLIPACAGKTTAGTPRSARPRAHPRVCGENIVSYVAVIVLCGSSPRVRGKRFRGVPCETATGLIPACAGKIQPLRG